MALAVVWEGSGRPFRGPKWSSQWSGRGWEALPKVRVGSGGPLTCLEGVWRPSQRSGRGHETPRYSGRGRYVL